VNKPELARADVLLEKVASGDEAAFTELYTCSVPRVLGRVITILRDPAQSEEVTQEVFLEIWEQASRYCPQRGRAISWMLTKARTRAIDRVRTAQSDRDRDIKMGIRDLATDTQPVVEAVEFATGVDDLYRARRALSPLQHQALVLSFIDEHSHAEIAEILGIPVGTVKSRIHSGIHALRNVLAGTS
jgi:RNA polymerase sigma-70 factor (ECF subfamily)